MQLTPPPMVGFVELVVHSYCRVLLGWLFRTPTFTAFGAGQARHHEAAPTAHTAER
jgi:hypothetical protein